MIRFALKCSNDHGFDSWFQSDAAFDKLRTAGLVACVTCGDVQISKSLMAPSVRPARSATQAAERQLRADPTEVEAAIAALRRQVEENSDYVGMNFVTEARRIHEGDAPERAIWGEARIEEARSLLEDGVPVAPLPFLPTRKTN